MMTWPPSRIVVALALALLASSCAARVVPTPPVPVTPKYPEYAYPGAPGAGAAVEARQERAWRFLQSGDLGNAEREFTDLLKARPGLAPAETGLGYVALAERDAAGALQRFEQALAWQPAYAPALAGRGQALLDLERSQEALEAFEAAVAADPALDFGSRIAVLRLRSVQDRVGEARSAAERRDWVAARDIYRAAIEASPDSGFLYRELAGVERRSGDLDRSMEHYRKAIELDDTDVRARIGLAEVLEERADLEGALTVYSEAWALEPSADLDKRIQSLRERLATAALPEEYQRIGGAPEVSRADVAAVLGVQMAPWLPEDSRQGVLVTDTRAHWASSWIVRAVRAGVMDPFPNHTFQPDLRVTRGDLARIVSRVLDLVAARRPGGASPWAGSRPRIVDVPPTHLAYPAVAQAVAAGVLTLEEGAFHLARPVTGAELVRVVDRLRALAGPAPVPPTP